MPQLILLRHGRSLWNLANRFTGWRDIPLSATGEKDAIKAGEDLQAHHNMAMENTHVLTSPLIRARETARLVMETYSNRPLSYTVADGMKERSYGILAGQEKNKVAMTYGKDVLQKWRRGYDEKPPEGESLAQVCVRVAPVLDKRILPHLRNGHDVLVVAHGNSLRALMMLFKRMSPEQILQVEIATATPIPLAYDKEHKHTATKTGVEQ